MQVQMESPKKSPILNTNPQFKPDEFIEEPFNIIFEEVEDKEEEILENTQNFSFKQEEVEKLDDSFNAIFTSSLSIYIL